MRKNTQAGFLPIIIIAIVAILAAGIGTKVYLNSRTTLTASSTSSLTSKLESNIDAKAQVEPNITTVTTPAPNAKAESLATSTTPIPPVAKAAVVTKVTTPTPAIQTIKTTSGSSLPSYYNPTTAHPTDASQITTLGGAFSLGGDIECVKTGPLGYQGKIAGTVTQTVSFSTKYPWRFSRINHYNYTDPAVPSPRYDLQVWEISTYKILDLQLQSPNPSRAEVLAAPARFGDDSKCAHKEVFRPDMLNNPSIMNSGTTCQVKAVDSSLLDFGSYNITQNQSC